MKETFTVTIGGMHCQSCVNRVSQALKKIGGVDVLDVKIGAATLACRSEQERQPIVEAIQNAGESVHGLALMHRSIRQSAVRQPVRGRESGTVKYLPESS